MVRVRYAALDERLHAVRYVVLYQQTPLVFSRPAEGVAMTRRSPELRLQHGVSTRCNKLSQPVKPVVIETLWPAMG